MSVSISLEIYFSYSAMCMTLAYVSKTVEGSVLSTTTLDFCVREFINNSSCLKFYSVEAFVF